MRSTLIFSVTRICAGFAIVPRVPRWLKRALNALGFATFLVIEAFGLWRSRPSLPNGIFTAVYLLVVALVGIAIDRALTRN